MYRPSLTLAIVLVSLSSAMSTDALANFDTSDRAGSAVRIDPYQRTRQSSWIARLVVKTPARVTPGGRVRYRIPTETPWSRQPAQLMVLGSREVKGRQWLQVRLPIRPNTAKGWVLADQVILSKTVWHVRVDRRKRTLAVYRAGERVRQWRVVVGKTSTPTPAGDHALWEEARQPDPRGELGPWALHLTAHSDVLDNYGGGPGRDSLHGRGGALLADPLGSARSHGCVRMTNANVSWLARRLAPGVPVTIR